jgi:hypothetical protein
MLVTLPVVSEMTIVAAVRRPESTAYEDASTVIAEYGIAEGCVDGNEVPWEAGFALLE